MLISYYNLHKNFKKILGIEMPSSLTWEGWEEWHDNLKKQKPIRYYLALTFPQYIKVKFIMPISEFIWKLKCKYIKKDHLIDISKIDNSPDKFTKYEWGPVATSQKMLFASFKILEDKIKNEGGIGKIFEHYNFLSPVLSEEAKIYRLMIDLHIWWNVIRPILIKNYDDSYSFYLKNKTIKKLGESNLKNDLLRKESDQKNNLLRLQEIKAMKTILELQINWHNENFDFY